jgi:exonuclease III
MKEVIWIGVNGRTSPCIKVCLSFIYNSPQNSRWYNPSFSKELEGDINNLKDSYPNSEFLIMGDWNSRIGTKQVDLPHLFDIIDNWDNSSHNWYGSRKSKDTVCNTEGRKLIDFCEKNGLEILNGKYGSDAGGEFTFVNQLGSSVIDYVLASDGIICNVMDFKVGVEIISSHMPLLVEFENIM